MLKGLLLTTALLTGMGSTSAFAATLHEGSQGPEVVQLQEKLASKGLYNYKIDGIYGPITLAGVHKFQEAEGIKDDGIVGPQTESLLEGRVPVAQPAPAPKAQTVVASQKTLTMTATAYTATGGAGQSGVTATGLNLVANPNQKVVAVDPNVIPLGTRLYVEGYGYAVAGDTGGAINGNRIDLFIPSEQDALNFGRQTVSVTILN